MKNCEMSVSGTILTVKIDLSKRFGPSGSGRTAIVATTSGNQAVPGFEKIKLGLNCYEVRK